MSALSVFLLLMIAQGGPESTAVPPTQVPTPDPLSAGPAEELLEAADPGAPVGTPTQNPATSAPGTRPGGAVASTNVGQLNQDRLNWERWVAIAADPRIVPPVWWGSILAWVKVLALTSLVGWVGGWVVVSIRTRPRARLTVGGARLADLTLVIGLLLGIGGIYVQIAQGYERIPEANLGSLPLSVLLVFISFVVIVLWAEWLIWTGIFRSKRLSDLFVLFGIHLGLVGGGFLASQFQDQVIQFVTGTPGINPTMGKIQLGAQFSLVLMGYITLLQTLAIGLYELFSVRPRRLFAVGRFSWIESFRKTRIPWAVLALFGVVLAFTHWFLQPPDTLRQAELSQLYVRTMMVLCSYLLILMIAILTPITLPNDIRHQTIHVTVTKPIRRLEVIWGRLFGFMAVVTVLLVLLGVFGGVYIGRIVGSRVEDLREDITQAEEAGNTRLASQLQVQLDQLETRRSARLPVGGSLTFVDSIGQPRIKGIDVGQELETRSFVEGATPAKAIWMFGPDLPAPVDRLLPSTTRTPAPRVESPVPVNLLLKRGTIEYLSNEIYETAYDEAELESEKVNADSSEISNLNRRIENLRSRREELSQQREDLVTQYEELSAEANELLETADATQSEDEANDLRVQASDLLAEAEALRSPDVPVQMTFTVYRTTKGEEVGAPVYAQIRVKHPFFPQPVIANRPEEPLLADPLFQNEQNNPLLASGRGGSGQVITDTFDVKEYYTNKWSFPSSILVGSRGFLTIEVSCISQTQYLGMAPDDLFIVANQGSFWANYAKGLFGIWLQAMVLTAIGLFAGTFLSWPVALLITLFFFVAGDLFYPILSQLGGGGVTGGGPFESIIRMVTHANQVAELEGTIGVITAKSLDAVFSPFLSILSFIVPNFSAFSLGDTVAAGFAITWGRLINGVLLAVGYALPFSVAAYFILKNREVAA